MGKHDKLICVPLKCGCVGKCRCRRSCGCVGKCRCRRSCGCIGKCRCVILTRRSCGCVGDCRCGSYGGGCGTSCGGGCGGRCGGGCGERRSFTLATRTTAGSSVPVPICPSTCLTLTSSTLTITATPSVCNNVTVDFEYLGVQGVQGAQGTQGYMGAQGYQGFVGVTGATGTQGLSGPTGTQGFSGANGLTGPQGLGGTQGVVGPQGPQGTAGSANALLNGFYAGPLTVTAPTSSTLISPVNILHSTTLAANTLTATNSVVELTGSGNISVTSTPNIATFDLYINSLPTGATISTAGITLTTPVGFNFTFRYSPSGQWSAILAYGGNLLVANGTGTPLTLTNPATFDLRGGFTTPAGSQFLVAQTSMVYTN